MLAAKPAAAAAATAQTTTLAETAKTIGTVHTAVLTVFVAIALFMVGKAAEEEETSHQRTYVRGLYVAAAVAACLGALGFCASATKLSISLKTLADQYA